MAHHHEQTPQDVIVPFAGFKSCGYFTETVLCYIASLVQNKASRKETSAKLQLHHKTTTLHQWGTHRKHVQNMLSTTTKQKENTSARQNLAANM